ncbi:hypothetical protein BDF19DRAFT_425642 [Syncephalis fuscata]|nr:hypothetical protein BDF19DRAFT_425642 [Syncephalis fuscata]
MDTTELHCSTCRSDFASKEDFWRHSCREHQLHFTDTFKKHVNQKHDPGFSYLHDENDKAHVEVERSYEDGYTPTNFEDTDENAFLLNVKKQNIQEELYSTHTPTAPPADEPLHTTMKFLLHVTLFKRSQKTKSRQKCGLYWQVASSVTRNWNGHTFHVLAGAETVLQIVSAQPQGRFSASFATPLPLDASLNDSKITKSWLCYCLKNGLFGEMLKQRDIIEMSREIAKHLQKNWLL